MRSKRIRNTCFRNWIPDFINSVFLPGYLQMLLLVTSALFMILIFRLNSWLILENLALRQQLAIFKRRVKRPGIKTRDRIFWVILSRFWKDWKDALIVVKPETVIHWHRQGFKLFWRFKSRQKNPGRPAIDFGTRKIIVEMAKENPLWGAPRMHGELMKLGIEVSERTISAIIKKCRPKPPSQTWRTFLKNHMSDTFAIDFFTVPTATFKVLYVFIVICHERRRVVHFNVTRHPTAAWTARQIVEACPWDTAPKYLIRDNDSIYGKRFVKRVANMGITEVKTAPKSPWQNGFCERLIGSIRRDCLDHVIVLNEDHLKRILTEYLAYYHEDRTHLGLEKDTPSGRQIRCRPERAKLVKFPRLGGLHHRYEWREAA